jgi:hypothetical protein
MKEEHHVNTKFKLIILKTSHAFVIAARRKGWNAGLESDALCFFKSY